MAGWTCRDRRNIQWDGNVISENFIGSGAMLGDVWLTDSNQADLTGSKSGSFNLSTTGIFTADKFLNGNSYYKDDNFYGTFGTFPTFDDIKVIDLVNQKLYYADNSLGVENYYTVDWKGQKLYSIGDQTNPALDWSNRVLKDSSSGTTSVNWDNRSLLDSGGNAVAIWDNEVLYDASQVISVLWDSRTLYDAAEVASANWNARELYDSVGALIVDWDTAKGVRIVDVLHVNPAGTTSWTNNTTIRGILITDSTGPRVIFEDTGRSTDNKIMTIRYESENMVFASMNDAGTAYDKDNIFKINRDGLIEVGADFIFTGEGFGMAYGEMYANNVTQTVTVAAQDTFYEIDGNITGGELNLVTFPDDHYLNITKAGRYKIDWHFSCYCASANQEIEGAVMIGGTAQTKGTAHGNMVTANSPITVSGTLIKDCAVNDQISLSLANKTSATDVVMQHLSLTALQIGGT